MSESTVAIIGSGIAATAVAFRLTERGHRVTLFEKGPDYPYPHSQQFRETIYYRFDNPEYRLPGDLKSAVTAGGYRYDIDQERAMVTGGSATHWTAMTPRMLPEDFRTRTLFGYGTDWPIAYADLEPYYCQAEAMLGVAGSDAGNPFAPPRSKDYPLPPFEFSHDDRLLAERLRANGITLHHVAQARTRNAYDGRPACQNFGTCYVCPIGARYSPNHHLARAVAAGRCTVIPNTSVRRLIADKSGRITGVLYQQNDSPAPKEHAAKVVVLAAGAIESPRILLLSSSEQWPDGFGNRGGQVGHGLTFHHMWHGTLRYNERLYAGRVGPLTAQTFQFWNAATRGRHGAVRVDFSSRHLGDIPGMERGMSARDILDNLRVLPRLRGIVLEVETEPSADKYVTLGDGRDRFGDPFALVHYDPTTFDRAAYPFVQQIVERFAHATRGETIAFTSEEEFRSGWHHMGTCRMGQGPRDSVVDSFGRVHDCPNLYIAGSSIFSGCSGAANPTLTIVALALRTADSIEHLLA